MEALANAIDEDGSGTLDMDEVVDVFVALGFSREHALNQASLVCGEVPCELVNY